MWMQREAQRKLQLLFVIIKGVDFHLAIYTFSPSIGEPKSFHWDGCKLLYFTGLKKINEYTCVIPVLNCSVLITLFLTWHNYLMNGLKALPFFL